MDRSIFQDEAPDDSIGDTEWMNDPFPETEKPPNQGQRQRNDCQCGQDELNFEEGFMLVDFRQRIAEKIILEFGDA
ncbi:hypothetical protein D3C72_2175050 [compost metagenome]